jgi:two-component system, OmpR family, KDP operon response regulator KdpE
MSELPISILVVDDEPQIRRFLRPALEHAGYAMHEAADGREALVQASTRSPDVILLDLGLPDIDGQEVLSRLREWYTAPVIILSARGEETAKVQALDSGADDYLTKPFSVAELLARLRVALRHAARCDAAEGSAEFATGQLRVDLLHRQVFLENREIHLTPLEYKLLSVLVKHAGMVLTHQYLMREVWGEAYLQETHYLRIYMRQLRHKLEVDPARPQYLQTELGVGYRLREE